MSNNKIKIIYEMANNHMGDINHGMKIVNELKDVSNQYDFDFAVKFQFRNLSSFIHPSFKGSDLKFVKRFEETVLKDNDWERLIDATLECGFKCITTPFDESSVDKAEKLGFQILKIASCSMSDWPLIEKMANTNKDIIFSTAGAELTNIDEMVAFFNNRNINFTMMHCVGKYPTPDYELQLGQLSFFKERYKDISLGYSTHEDPNNVVAAGIALGLGATTFEKHVAVKTSVYGVNDYSATPEQINLWLSSILKSSEMIGIKNKKAENSKEEITSLKALQRGAFAKRDLSSGTKITLEDLEFCIPVQEDGYTANDFSKYTEFVSKTNIKKMDSINTSNTEVTNLRNDILDIVKQIRSFVDNENIIIPNGEIMEISHHYGLASFKKFGLVMFTIVNEEYCKKLLFLLPGQCHPAQYHKIKRETFHVLSGSLNIKLDNVKKTMKIGDVLTIEANQIHEFSSDEGCIVEEISSNHKNEDSFYIDENITKNKNRKTFVNFWR